MSGDARVRFADLSGEFPGSSYRLDSIARDLALWAVHPEHPDPERIAAWAKDVVRSAAMLANADASNPLARAAWCVGEELAVYYALEWVPNREELLEWAKLILEAAIGDER